MIRGIHHTAISTGDLERLLRFYRDLLGFEEVSSFSWNVGSKESDKITGLRDSSARAVMLKAGNAFLEIFEFATPTPKTGDANRPVCDHGITHICLAVSGIEEEYERLKASGMIFHCAPTTSTSGKVTYGRDPDGNVVELLEVTNAKSLLSLDTSARAGG